SGVLPVNAESYAIQFYLSVANDERRKLTVSSGKPRCCWEVEKGDIDCDYAMDRIGKCHFLLKVNKHKIQHVVLFNTTEPRQVVDWKQALAGFGGEYKTCKGVDLDPRNDCEPVDCLEKYNGYRSFFEKEKGKCRPVHNCYTKMENNDLPEIAFDKDFNECKSLISDKLTDKQKKFLLDKSDHSSLARKRFNLENVKEINPIPLNCNNGRRVGSMCVCDDGWGTDTAVVANDDARYIFNWCNKKILSHYTLSVRLQTFMMMTKGLGLISFSLLIGWIVIIWGCFIVPSNGLTNELSDELIESDEDYFDDSSSSISSLSDSSQPRYAIVIKSYESRKDDELTLKKGQRLWNLQYTNREGMMKIVHCDPLNMYNTVEHSFRGTIVHSTDENPLTVLHDKVIGINNEGIIVFLEDSSQLEHLQKTFDFTSDQMTVLREHQFLIPGFIDTHIHAPQYRYMGTGYDVPLMDWLEKYTFPCEAKFKDAEFAKMTYDKVVQRTLDHGTTTASYFATIHYEATTILADVIEVLGQRAYVGKVCMDRNAPDYYIEDTQQSLQDTERFINYVQHKHNPLIKAVVTPRFVITCTDELLEKLAALSRKYQLPIQSHLSENIDEINHVLELYPDCEHYTGVYKQFGLLTDRSYMAHCCHVSIDEISMLSGHATGVSHCPSSNINLRSGFADVRLLENKNIKVGLGTDIGAGNSYSMLSVIQSAINVSNSIAIHNNANNNEYNPITHKEAFYMATLGGSKVLGLDKKIGNFEVGKEFDVLLVDAAAHDSPFDCFDGDDMDDVIQKFLYCGDDRNIKKVFVAGKCVAGTDKKLLTKCEIVKHNCWYTAWCTARLYTDPLNMYNTVEHSFRGTIVHSTDENPLTVLHDKVIGINNEGIIVFLEDSSQLEHLQKTFDFTSDQMTVLREHQFLIPGFIDTHIHAPQYRYMGTGYDVPLMDWLEKYTFPCEAKFKDAEFAKMTYDKVVQRTLDHGTTTASYFATIHYEATTILADVIEVLGQRAYVGKVCMDRNAPDYYIENTQQSLQDTERFINYVQHKHNPLIKAVVTPRFVITCTDELLEKLAALSRKYQLPIQSHLSENIDEINHVLELYPDCEHYTGVYKQFGLLTDRSYMAHCCHVSIDEISMLSGHATGVSHCPSSNINLRSGFADVRLLENKNIKVGLGTDIGAGNSYSMLSVIQSAINVSNSIAIHNNANNNEYNPITHKEAFYMATLGGSKVLGLDKKIGNFEVGKEFDVLLVDAAAHDSPFDCFDGDDMDDVIQKFLYCGDDRNIKKVFVAGKCVAGTDKKLLTKCEIAKHNSEMHVSFPKARIIYNRVGKCGSRYLLNMMSNVAEGNGFRLVDYTDDRILDSRKRKLSMSEQMQFITYIDKQLAPPFIFHGHFHFVDFAKFGVAKPVYINLIRDPLERFISAYYYSRFGDGRNRSWSFKGTEKQKNMSLDDCVLKNHSECFTPNKLLYIIPYFCGQPSGCRVYWERSLAQAIENVKINYLVVGVLEDVHNFIKVLEALLPHFFKGTYQLSTAEIGNTTMEY
ncbi:hypothetical protein QZH41_019925, partial [Actinostola sp. cb2023]